MQTIASLATYVEDFPRCCDSFCGERADVRNFSPDHVTILCGQTLHLHFRVLAGSRKQLLR